MQPIIAPPKPNTARVVEVPIQLTCGLQLCLPFHINYNMLEIASELAEILQCSPDELLISCAATCENCVDNACQAEPINQSLVLAGLDFESDSFQLHVRTPSSFDSRRLSMESNQCAADDLSMTASDPGVDPELMLPAVSERHAQYSMDCSLTTQLRFEKQTAAYFTSLVDASNNLANLSVK